jgi:metal-responsive CopG/Arc/MetJ family transcriptional regulator
MSTTARLTISLPQSLLALTDEVASEKKISRSKLISDCLSEFAQKRKIELMEEGYKAMAKENLEIAKLAFPLQREVALRQEF